MAASNHSVGIAHLTVVPRNATVTGEDEGDAEADAEHGDAETDAERDDVEAAAAESDA